MKKFFVLVSFLSLFVGYSFAYQYCSTYEISLIQSSISTKQQQLQNAAYLWNGWSSAAANARTTLQSDIDSLQNQLISAQNTYDSCIGNNTNEIQSLSKQEEFNTRFDKWYASFEKGDYLNAADYYQKALNAYPSSPDSEAAKSNLSLCYWKLWDWYYFKEDFDNAIIYYNKYLEKNPNDFTALTNIGNIYLHFFNIEGIDKALTYFQKALSLAFDKDKIEFVNQKIAIAKNIKTWLETPLIKTGNIKKSDNTTTSTNTITTTNTANELSDAILWMYNNWLTNYNTVSDFNGDDYLTREQASKFFVLFSKKILGKSVDTSKSVSLSDLKKANKTLQTHIKEAAQLWLFNWKGKFLPFNKLTIAQTIAVIVRSMDGPQNEKWSKWYSEYYTIANDKGLLNGLWFDYSILDSVNIKRKEVAVMLYRASNLKK